MRSEHLIGFIEGNIMSYMLDNYNLNRGKSQKLFDF